jgi:hypothetical protein
MQDTLLFALVAGAALLGVGVERLRARWARQAWLARKGRGRHGHRAGDDRYRDASPVPLDASAQLRLVMEARFEKQRILSKSEARVFFAAEQVIREAGLPWRLMAQVSLGEVLSSPDARAFGAINSKRVDLLVITNGGEPIAAIEYQGAGHYQGSAPARDAVKREALRRAGVRFIEITDDHGPKDLAHELSRVAKVEGLKRPVEP